MTKRSRSGSFETDLAVRRRDFLWAGAAAAAAVAGPLARNTAAAEQADSPTASASEGPAPATLEEASAWVGERLSETPPFGDPAFEEQASKNCPETVDYRLVEPDESCEVVLALLWREFAIGAAPHAKDIAWEALRAGRVKIRGDVRADVEQVLACAGGDDCLKKFPYEKYLAKWRQLGKEAGEAADPGDQGELLIEQSHFDTAWTSVYGAHQAPATTLLPEHEATELIGNHLLFRFTLGDISAVYRNFDLDVVRAGRGHSRYYVHANVLKRKVTAGGSPPNYEKWAFGPVGVCAFHAGARSSRKAGNQGASTITATNFHDAWCQTSATVKKLAMRQGMNWGDMAQGCG